MFSIGPWIEKTFLSWPTNLIVGAKLCMAIVVLSILCKFLSCCKRNNNH